MAAASLPNCAARAEEPGIAAHGSAARARARSQRACGRRLDAMRCIGRAEGSHHSMNGSGKVQAIEERLMLYVEEVVSARIEIALNEQAALLESRLLASLQQQLGVSQRLCCQ